MDKQKLMEAVAEAMAHEIEALLKYAWSETLEDIIRRCGPTLSDDERQELNESITWTLIDEKTGRDLLQAIQ